MPKQMNPGQARVIDPILTSHSIGYSHPEHVLNELFPTVDVQTRGGKVINFDRSSFILRNTRRAPGANTKRVLFGYSGETISLHQDALEGIVPIELMEEAAAIPGIALGTQAVDDVMSTLSLGSENEKARIATDANSYAAGNKEALSGADIWSDPTSNPLEQIDDAKESVRAKIGRYPNVLVISPSGLKALKQNEKIKDHYKYTSGDSITASILANYFDVDKVVVPKAVALSPGALPDADFEDVWGNNGVLAYVPQGGRHMREPSFGYNYRLKGHPLVEKAYYDNNARSWVYPVIFEERPYLTGVEAGYLFQNLTA